LCGTDRLTGRSFDHRKSWVVEKLAALSSIFAIRLCAYAVLRRSFLETPIVFHNVVAGFRSPTARGVGIG